MKKINLNFKLIHISLLIFPLLYFVIATVSKLAFGDYYMRIEDPEYAYLFNGLSLSRLELHLGHIDHPGTPLQLLIAINIWIIQLFKMDHSILENVVSNPELYLRSSFYSVIFINCLAIFFTGLITFKAHNIITALFIQIIPFSVSRNVIDAERLIPETMQMFTVLALISLIIMYINNDKFRISLKYYIILFSTIIGFGVSLKINFLPVIFIPLFLIPKNNRPRYLIYTISAFFVFGFPVLFRLEKFYKWVVSIITHQGGYGVGDKGFTNLPDLFHNINLLYNDNKLFFTVQLLIIVSIAALLMTKKAVSEKQKTIIRILTGILVASVFSVIIVGKHFAYRYFRPFNTIYIFEIYLLIILTDTLYKKELFKKSMYCFLTGFSFFILFFSINNFLKDIKNQNTERIKIEQTVNYIKEHKPGSPFFIGRELYGDPCNESAIYFGFLWTGNNRLRYISTLQNIYPDTYIYSLYYKKYSYWDGNIDTISLINRKQEGAFVFVGRDQEDYRTELFTQIGKIYSSSYNVDTLYKNTYKKEALYKLDFK